MTNAKKMKRQLKLIIAAVLVFIGTGIHQSVHAQEQFLLHTNKPFYVTGEVVWYTVFLPPSLNNQETVIKTYIIDPKGRVKKEFFLNSNSQPTINGYFKIPFEFSSGLYQMVFQSSFSDTEPDVTLVQATLPVYSDLRKDLPEPNDETLAFDDSEMIENALDLSINIPASTIAPGNSISGQISVNDASGNPVNAEVSISIIDGSLNHMTKDDQPTVFVGPEINRFQLPQIANTLYYKGVIMNGEQTPIQASVVGAYAGTTNRMYYTKSNPDGNFRLKVNPFYGDQSIQFVSYQEPAELKVKLAAPPSSGGVQGQLPVNEDIVEYLKWSQARKKMSQHFELASPVAAKAVENEINPLTSDFTFNTKEYVKFERVIDFFSELLTPLRFKTEDSLYVAYMYNPAARSSKNDQLTGEPLFIIDGKVTRNADFIARLDLSNIETIDLFYKPLSNRRQFNVLGMSGVVKMETFIPQFDLPENDKEDVFTVSGFQEPGTFLSADQRHSASGRLPNFASAVYWNGQISIENGNGSFAFSTTDDRGAFVIQVVARTADGKVGIGSIGYRVE